MTECVKIFNGFNISNNTYLTIYTSKIVYLSKYLFLMVFLLVRLVHSTTSKILCLIKYFKTTHIARKSQASNTALK